MAQRRGQRGRSYRPSTNWSFQASTAYAVLAANTKLIVAIFAPTLAQVGETVRRSRCTLGIGTDQGAGIEEQIGAFAAGVFSDEAIAAGAASLPDPITQGGDDYWFLYQPFMRKGMDSSAAAPTFTEYMIDSKAMRKVEPGKSVVYMLVNSHATHGLEWSVNIRMLSSTTGA